MDRFLKKTFDAFSNTNHSSCCGWGPNGDTIVVHNRGLFEEKVLPKYFKHSNYSSFVHQLNMYNFQETSQNASLLEYKHEFFQQNQENLLIHMKRKTYKPARSTFSGTHVQVYEMSELQQLVARQNAFERRMESKITALECENAYLKAMFNKLEHSSWEVIDDSLKGKSGECGVTGKRTADYASSDDNTNPLKKDKTNSSLSRPPSVSVAL